MSRTKFFKLLLRSAPALVRKVRTIIASRLYGWASRRFGRNVRIGPGVYISHPVNVSYADNVYLEGYSRLSAEHPDGTLELGPNVQINTDVMLDYSGGLILEQDVLVSEGAIVYTHDHGLDPRSIPSLHPKVVGAGVWIGARAIILPTCAEIGEGSIVGAGAIVTKNVPPRCIVAGNPAQIVRRLDS